MWTDEWWGDAKDHLPRLLGEDVEAGRIKMQHGDGTWFAQDVDLNHGRVVCWRRGDLFLDTRFSPATHNLPCFGAEPVWSQTVCIYHLAEYKKHPQIKALQFPRIKRQDIEALRQIDEFALAPDGVWFPRFDAFVSHSRPAEQRMSECCLSGE